MYYEYGSVLLLGLYLLYCTVITSLHVAAPGPARIGHVAVRRTGRVLQASVKWAGRGKG